jgi:hypothetical protein
MLLAQHQECGHKKLGGCPKYSLIIPNFKKDPLKDPRSYHHLVDKTLAKTGGKFWP